jgi:ketosteroid isomerase-like protein
MKFFKYILSFIIASTTGWNLYAQEKKEADVLREVLSLDSAFWRHYNSCNVEAMRSFFTDDLEFYHDKGGVTNGADKLIEVSKRNLCSNDNFRLRRDVVPGTVEIYPMYSNNVLYGAVLTGQHVFYILEKGKEPNLDGLARFTHLWLKTERGWKMSRVLSYDHGPASRLNEKKSNSK